MNKILLKILFFFPLTFFTQNSTEYFDISKDEFYHEKMGSWKERAYKNPNSEFETIIDNDSLFKFRAQNSLFIETYTLTLRNKKINKIELIFQAIYGSLDDYFPYRYPININDLFKELGKPKDKRDNYLYKPEHGKPGLEYVFKKYYKWDALSKKTQIELVVADGILKVPVRNRRGKIRKYKFYKIGYISQTPKFKRETSKKQLNYNVSYKVSEGFKYLWKENSYELKSLLGQKDFENSEAILNSKMFDNLFYVIDENNPNEYFTKFFFQASGIFRIKLNEIMNPENRNFTYTTLSNDLLAKASGMKKKCCIDILIDLEKWNKSNYVNKLFILYHELGHDAFELKHSDGLRLMATNEINFENPSILGEMIFEMFFSLLKEQKK